MRTFAFSASLLILGSMAAAAVNPQWVESRRNGASAREQGKYADARRWFETALTQAAFDSTDLRRADLDDELAGMCQMFGDEVAAENLYADALRILDKHPNDGVDVRAVVLGGFGIFRARQGRLAEAEDALQRAVASAGSAFGDRDPRLASAESSLGQVRALEGNLADAEPSLAKAIRILKASPAPDAPDRIIAQTTLGSLYTTEGRYSEAESLLSQANEEASHLAMTSPTYAGTMMALADLYRVEGRSARGEPLLKKAQAIYETAFGPDSPRVGEVLLDRSLDSLVARKAAIAEDQIGKALDILRKSDGPEHPTVGIGELRLAQAYVQQGNYVQAEPLLRHAIPIEEKTWPGGHFVIGDCLFELAEVERQQQNLAGAELDYQKAIAAYEKAGSSGTPGLAIALRQYARLLKTSRPKEAKVLEKRANGLLKNVQSFK